MSIYKNITIYSLITVLIFQFSFLNLALAEETAIETGDADSVTVVENEMNQSEVGSGGGDESSGGEETTDEPAAVEGDGESGIINEELGEENGEGEFSPEADQPLAEEITNDELGEEDVPDSGAEKTVENDNQAGTDNDVAGASDSGNNTIASSGDAVINTGDADTVGVIGNDINSNKVDLGCETCIASGSPEIASGSPDTASGTIAVDNDNDASTTNAMALDGNSGANTIASSGDAAISTGDVSVLSILINYINTNFVGPGKDFFINIFSALSGNLDLSGYNKEEDLPETDPCAADNCELNVSNDNDSELDNTVNIDATSGDNTIASSGDAVIETGDVIVINDIANFANINVTGEDWFFAIVNIFGRLEGDIILPAIEDKVASSVERINEAQIRLSQEIDQVEKLSSQIFVTNDNNSTLDNQVAIVANTGENEISNTEHAVIETGSAVVESKIYNLVNYNFYGNKWRMAKVNIFGSWQGFVQGLPPGMSYLEDQSGVVVYNDFTNEAIAAAQEALDVDNDNQATTTNEVNIYASSGGNRVLNSGSGSISTGDVSVHNSLLNFINANFTGNSWEFAMINVFGEWMGNLSYGQPDLWINETLEAPEPAGLGDRATFTFVFGNKGDATARDVFIVDDYDEELLALAGMAGGQGVQGNILWQVDELPPNSVGSLSYTTKVADDLGSGNYTARNNVFIASDDGDRDISNNSDSGAFQIAVSRTNSEGNKPIVNGSRNYAAGSSGSGAGSGLAIIKYNDAYAPKQPGDVVTFTIKVHNLGADDLYDVLVLDVLSDEADGTEISRDLWDLQTVYSGEEVTIEYTLEVTENTWDAKYQNEVMAEGYDADLGQFVRAVASSRFKVDRSYGGGPVVKAATAAPLLTIEKSPKQSTAQPGGRLLYQIVVANNGQLAAANVTLSEELPAGLTFSEEEAIMVKEWNLGDLDQGEVKKIDFYVYVMDTAAIGDFEPMAKLISDNHDTLSANSIVKIVQPQAQVLTASGFDNLEFMGLVAILTSVLIGTFALRRRMILGY